MQCCCAASKLCLTLWNLVDYSTPDFPILHHLPKFAQTHIHWVGNTILILPSPPDFSLSHNHGLSSEMALHIRWLKCWSFSFSISPSNEYSGVISLSIDWFDLFAVQGTLQSSPAPQFKSINSVGSAFFMVQLSHLYMTTGKTIALAIRTIVNKVMSLLLNMLSRFVIAFLPKSKCLLISWQQWFWGPRK